MLGFGRFRWRYVTGGSDAYVAALAGAARRPAAARPRRALDPPRSRRRRDRRPTTARARGSTRSSSRRTPTRRSRCSRIRPTTSGACSARSSTRATRRCCTPTRRSCRARAAARASWNYRMGDEGRPTVTYYLNRLQRLDTGSRLLRHAERQASPRSTSSTAASSSTRSSTSRRLAAQRELPALSGVRRTWYAGAHHGNGFHEDGLASGVRGRCVAGGRLVRSALYEGTLVHTRRTPVRNVFRYPVSYWLLDLDELPELDRRLRLFSVNRPNVVSFRDARPLRRRAVGEAGRDRRRRRPVDRARAAADAAAGARLRLQPRLLLLVLPRRRLARLHRRGAEQHLRRAAAGGAARPGARSTSTRSASTSRRSSGSTRATSRRSRSRARPSGRGSTSARTRRAR